MASVAKETLVFIGYKLDVSSDKCSIKKITNAEEYYTQSYVKRMWW